jgi:hypothetical protein
MIRFFCQADTSQIGTFALTWLPFLQSLDLPIRIAATGANIQTDRGGRSTNPWAKYASLFATTLDDGQRYANIVALPSSEWARRPASVRPMCLVNVLLVCDSELESLRLGSWLNNYVILTECAESNDLFKRAMGRATALERSFPRSVISMKPTSANLAAFRFMIGL